MTTFDLTYASAAELSELLSSSEVSAVELTEAAVSRIENIEPRINAVCVRNFEAARRAAREADARLAAGERGPLLGIPMTVKESFNLAGTPTTWGFAQARDFQPADDALAVQRLKRSGAVILGKTNVPVALGDWQSYNDIYGVTNNPYDYGRSPGGSSGGSAAALAAGYGPLSLGSDVGGSLRVPAHFCGVFAHKPTLNLLPTRGHVPPGVPIVPLMQDLSVIGPMARTASDLVSVLDVVAGPDEFQEGVGFRLQLPPSRHDNIKDFRILVLSQHPLAPTGDEVASAIENLASELERAGAKVERQNNLLPDLEKSSRLFCRLLMAAMAGRWPQSAYDQLCAAAAALKTDDQTLRAERLRGATASFRQWAADDGMRLGMRARWRILFERFDAVICPVTPTAAFPHDHSPDQEERKFQVNGIETPYLSNLLWPGLATLPGLPATTLPVGATRSGLPIGVQIVGPWLEDRTSLKLAELVEQVVGGFRPPLL